MTDKQPQPDIKPPARELVAAVGTLISQIMGDILRMQMQGTEAAQDRYAHACLDEMPGGRIPALVAAHDAMAAALNAASPDAPPILSLVTLRPA